MVDERKKIQFYEVNSEGQSTLIRLSLLDIGKQIIGLRTQGSQLKKRITADLRLLLTDQHQKCRITTRPTDDLFYLDLMWFKLIVFSNRTLVLNATQTWKQITPSKSEISVADLISDIKHRLKPNVYKSEDEEFESETFGKRTLSSFSSNVFLSAIEIAKARVEEEFDAYSDMTELLSNNLLDNPSAENSEKIYDFKKAVDSFYKRLGCLEKFFQKLKPDELALTDLNRARITTANTCQEIQELIEEHSDNTKLMGSKIESLNTQLNDATYRVSANFERKTFRAVDLQNFYTSFLAGPEIIGVILTVLAMYMFPKESYPNIAFYIGLCLLFLGVGLGLTFAYRFWKRFEKGPVEVMSERRTKFYQEFDKKLDFIIKDLRENREKSDDTSALHRIVEKVDKHSRLVNLEEGSTTMT